MYRVNRLLLKKSSKIAVNGFPYFDWLVQNTRYKLPTFMDNRHFVEQMVDSSGQDLDNGDN